MEKLKVKSSYDQLSPEGERSKECELQEMKEISTTLHDLTAKYQNRYLFFIVKRPITIETIPHIVNQVLINFTDFENATIKALREKNLNVMKYTDELAKNLEKAVKQINGLRAEIKELEKNQK